MQIELRNPYIPQTATKVDVKDFCHIDIHIEGQRNVNHYLLSLWHQFDIALHPEQAKNRLSIEFSCDEDVYCVRPQIDISTGTCCQDISRFSFRKNGESFAVTIQNVREWTTYILRSYYQKTFFGKTKFDIEIQDDVTTNSYIPNYVLKVSEALEAKGVQITLKGL